MIGTTTGNSNLSANNLNRYQAVNSLTLQENNRSSQKEKFQFTTDQVNLTYSLTATSETITTYNRSMSLETRAEDGYDLLRGLVLNIFKEQGIDYKIATDNAEIDIGTISPEAARELIADDGYFGVEQTSERIFNFAVGMAGGDPGRMAAIRQGVEHGFQEALDAFGGRLPDISYDTYDTVMKKLDDWAGITRSPQA
jgi:hypothetical protein